MSKLLYPAAPATVRPEKLAPSAAFRMRAVMVVLSIFLFLATYLLLLALSVALVYGAFHVVIYLIAFGTLGILLAAGIVICSLSVFYFMIKFLFTVSKNENPMRLEITEKEQPVLFEFISNLAKDSGVPFPKKVFIVPDVNAAVFYNAGFTSMFFPVKKNLEIGLGFVNTVNISEFKAVIAHEFGHFSQRSLKLGVFTYNTNRVIYNMLYENEGYASFLNNWAGIHSVLTLFAMLTSSFARGIQGILRLMYKLINKTNLALSREMEFHADTFSASLAGGNNLISALSRIELADRCYNVAVNVASRWASQNKIAQNIYKNQRTVLRNTAAEWKLPMQDGLPQVSFQFMQSFSRSRVTWTNQWASHPTLEQRQQNMVDAGMDAATDETSAWVLFQDREMLEERLTENLYHAVSDKDKMQPYDEAEFDNWHNALQVDHEFPGGYNGFYEKRSIAIQEWDLDALAASPVRMRFDEIFTEEHAQISASIGTNKSDIDILKAINEARIDANSFDFDGTKYKRDACITIIEQLEDEITALENKQKDLDKQAYAYFYQHAGAEKEALKEAYTHFKAFSQRTNKMVKMRESLNKTMAPFFDRDLSFRAKHNAADELRNIVEPAWKAFLQQQLLDGIIKPEAINNLQERIKKYIESKYIYLGDSGFKQREIDTLVSLSNDMMDEMERQHFRRYKLMLDKQWAIYTQQAPIA